MVGWIAMTLSIWAVTGPSGASDVRFVERSRDWGLEFRHHHGGSGQRYMIETMVGGVVAFDYDGDGDEDVLWVDGGLLPGTTDVSPGPVLHRNDGGRFVDVTASAGIAFAGYGCGATIGDIDGDGDLDLLLTAFARNALFVNQGDGTFVDETEMRGLAEDVWSSSAAFADADLDGDLDLYVGSYVDFSIENHKACGKPEEGILGYCHPDAYEGLRDRYYRNLGDGVFEEVGVEVGLEAAREATLGVIFADLDGDLFPDLYLANDLDPNQFFRNQGDGTFTDETLFSGAGYGLSGRPEAGMGVDHADLDGDGRPDLVVTNFALETTAFYRNNGHGLFVDQRFPSRLAEPSLNFLAFGIVAGDLEHDGDLDLVIANGHILDNAAELSTVKDYAQRNQVMRNDGGVFGELLDVGLDQVRVSRGMVLADLDLDLDLDLAIINSNEDSEVYENVSPGSSPAIIVGLRRSGPVATVVGGRIDLEVAAADGKEPTRQSRWPKSGGSYLSHSAVSAHFGLGRATPKRLVIQPASRNSSKLVIDGISADRRILVEWPSESSLRAP